MLWFPVGWNGAASIHEFHLCTDRFIYLTMKPVPVQHWHLMRVSQSLAVPIKTGAAQLSQITVHDLLKLKQE